MGLRSGKLFGPKIFFLSPLFPLLALFMIEVGGASVLSPIVDSWTVNGYGLGVAAIHRLGYI